jgi:hypothetical protein
MSIFFRLSDVEVLVFVSQANNKVKKKKYLNFTIFWQNYLLAGLKNSKKTKEGRNTVKPKP